MSEPIVRTAGALFGALCLSVAVHAQTPKMGPAQSPATNPVDAGYAKQQQERQITQPLNNQPVWSEARSGAPQFTSLPGRETNVLIQPQGQTWRALRTPIMGIGALLITLAVAGLAVFYLARGKLDYQRRAGDLVIERFTPMDRVAHWLLAITWVTLAITGLILSMGKNVLLPLIGYTLFSWLAAFAKSAHNFIGPLLIVAIPLLFARFVRDNGIGTEDVKWFTHIMGYFRGHEYPSGKFNAGEKLVFWLLLVVLSTILLVTGLVLVFPNFDQTRSTMQTANVIHMVAAYIAIALACVHIYLGTIGMTDAYRAMRDGYVDASWAKHHHQRWYEDVVAGRAREHFVQPADVPPGTADAAPALKEGPA
jgi:formate dehydrogenase subunit gamma